jgi:hypothetical protein
MPFHRAHCLLLNMAQGCGRVPEAEWCGMADKKG